LTRITDFPARIFDRSALALMPWGFTAGMWWGALQCVEAQHKNCQRFWRKL
jgi:hypothetical protein